MSQYGRIKDSCLWLPINRTCYSSFDVSLHLTEKDRREEFDTKVNINMSDFVNLMERVECIGKKIFYDLGSLWLVRTPDVESYRAMRGTEFVARSAFNDSPRLKVLEIPSCCHEVKYLRKELKGRAKVYVYY